MAVVLLAAGCGGDPAGPPTSAPLTAADLVGAYALVAVGGRPLPASSPDAGVRLVADTLWLRPDGAGRRARYVVASATGALRGPVGWGVREGWRLGPGRDSLTTGWAEDPGTRFAGPQPFQVLDRGERLVSTSPDFWCYGAPCQFRRVR